MLHPLELQLIEAGWPVPSKALRFRNAPNKTGEFAVKSSTRGNSDSGETEVPTTKEMTILLRTSTAETEQYPDFLDRSSYKRLLCLSAPLKNFT